MNHSTFAALGGAGITGGQTWRWQSVPNSKVTCPIKTEREGPLTNLGHQGKLPG